MPYELDGSVVNASGATRPGLVIASIQGMNAALDIVPDLDAEDVEHPFSFAANSFPELLQQFLVEAMKLAQTKKEAYLDVKLNLITDAKMDGSFVGKPAHVGKEFANVAIDGSIQKGEDGFWRAKIRFG